MHQLYMHYVSCRGEWDRCSLVVSIRKQTAHSSDEIYEWWDEKKMKAELGEELAVDLMKRHADAESKLSAAEKGKFIRVHKDFPSRKDLWKYKNFAAYIDKTTKQITHSAELSMQAEVEEESFHTAMWLCEISRLCKPPTLTGLKGVQSAIRLRGH
ncbi:unnamed protein product [Effrenium voratum]|nr:unnamed protein product [Effrenium voratum]